MEHTENNEAIESSSNLPEVSVEEIVSSPLENNVDLDSLIPQSDPSISGEDQKLVDEYEAGLKDKNNSISEARAAYIESIENYLNQLKEQSNEIKVNPEATENDIKAAEIIDRNIDFIQSGDAIFKFVDVSKFKRLDSLTLFNHSKARSVFRIHRSTGLKYDETLKAIKRINDDETRHKMICMFNTVLAFAEYLNTFKSPDMSIKNYRIFFKFIFMVIRVSSKINLMPQLAASSYERFKKVQ